VIGRYILDFGYLSYSKKTHEEMPHIIGNEENLGKDICRG